MEIEKVTYEQCPFEWSHVREIYRRLPSEPVEDGVWLEQASQSGRTVLYRRKGEYFQFFSGDASTSLFQKCKELDPMLSEDDAEWDIEKHGENEYLVRSGFTITFGPCDVQGVLDGILTPHGLWLDNRGADVSGAATFSRLHRDELREACLKLTALEAWCLKGNIEVMQTLNRYWSEVWRRLKGGF